MIEYVGFSPAVLNDYANNATRVFFDNLLTDDQKEWAWYFIQLVKHYFPNADHYTLRATTNNPYISIGQKAITASKGYPFFDLYFRYDQPNVWVNSHRVENEVLGKKNRHAYFDSIKLEEMDNWFNKVIVALGKKGLKIEGQGLAPKDYQNLITPNEEEDLPEFLREDKKNMAELNKILYGPPGTGKTYATIDEALKILDPNFFENFKADRIKLKTRFEELKQNGQVVFCTFHQSFSYEDFVEGIRAKSNKQGQLEYEVEQGVFKKICDDAKENLTSNFNKNSFSAALSKLYQKLDESKDDSLELETFSHKKFSIRFTGGKTFKVYPESSKNNDTNYASIENIEHLYKTGDKSKAYNPSYVQGILNYLKSECGLKDYEKPKTDIGSKNKYVLIIDEINRGNISRIFGELITLIEPSKRAGEDEALEVTLPYSKDPFSVPNNVYLIGTMNTADRSLAGLDIALRRRFSFIEMPPKPELLEDIFVEDVDIKELLIIINQRIEALLDRDHCLGHAYFMELKTDKTLEKLAFIFQQKILPLLQEYFFEDWERIRWVLNDHRKATENQFITQADTKISDLFGFDLELQNKQWCLNPKAFINIKSYAGILKGDPS